MPKSTPVVIAPKENNITRIVTISRDGIVSDTRLDEKDETETENCSP